MAIEKDVGGGATSGNDEMSSEFPQLRPLTTASNTAFQSSTQQQRAASRAPSISTNIDGTTFQSFNQSNQSNQTNQTPEPGSFEKSRHNSILMSNHAIALESKPRTASGHDIHPHFVDTSLHARSSHPTSHPSAHHKQPKPEFGEVNLNPSSHGTSSATASAANSTSSHTHSHRQGFVSDSDGHESPGTSRSGSHLNLENMRRELKSVSASNSASNPTHGDEDDEEFFDSNDGTSRDRDRDRDRAVSPSVTEQTRSSRSSPAPSPESREQTPDVRKPKSDPRIPQNDGKIHILIGLTGSLHVNALKPIVNKLYDIYGEQRVSIQVILTTAAVKMLPKSDIPANVQLWQDSDEWDTWKCRSDPVIHIELRRWADILLVAPLSANTLGKISLGLCDNLLTNVIRAWNAQYPILIAPGMQSYSYNHPATKWHIKAIKEEMKWIEILKPTEKVVGSYGDIGLGGMMPWPEIVDKIVMKLGGYPDDEEEEDDDEDKGGREDCSEDDEAEV